MFYYCLFFSFFLFFYIIYILYYYIYYYYIFIVRIFFYMPFLYAFNIIISLLYYIALYRALNKHEDKQKQTIKRLAVWRREYTRVCPLFARFRVYLSVQNRILI